MPINPEKDHQTGSSNHCYHCGEDCGSAPVQFDEKIFCCNGCRMVYEILSRSNACDYYCFEQHPGLKVAEKEIGSRFAWLDQEEIRKDLLEYSDGGISKVRLFIPAIHCSSCIWLLENLARLHSGVIQSSVNFIKKELIVTFRDQVISLRQLVELLVSVNYVPHLSLDTGGDARKARVNRGIYYRLGVAGFCFGNIMLFSFPAYLSVNDAVEQLLRQNFGILNILFAIPVAFYSGSVYLSSAWKGLRKRFVSIDVPIAIGILVLFFRSAYEIISGEGYGFMDSLAGLVFFLSVGRWYQDKTYQALSFERDYRSYFPVAVTLIDDYGKESIIPLRRLKPGMRILVRNMELIPADSLLISGEGSIDYSFVSGESTPVPKKNGDRVFAGGRQMGTSIELVVEKEVEQSRLTELWNQDMTGNTKPTRWNSIIDLVSQYFTVFILLFSLVSGMIWWWMAPSEAFIVVTAVLIVACPCALAMTLPFTFGGTLRIFGKNNLYLKKASVVELLAGVDTVVFDKTGTITTNDGQIADLSELSATGSDLAAIHSLVRNSTHPASQAICQILHPYPVLSVQSFSEIPSKGLQAIVNGSLVKVGSETFVKGSVTDHQTSSKVFVSVDQRFLGTIGIRNRYRPGMKEVLTSLSKKYELHLLSGDNDAELQNLLGFFPSREHIHFNQSPIDKLNYIRSLKAAGKTVLMIGDGLNDAGALRESHCGISVADDVYHFSPACDAILESVQFGHLADFLKFSRRSMRIVYLSMSLSFIYNVVGLTFAVTGNLSPVVSAILMPLSSVSVIGFITLLVYISGRISALPVSS